jgi:hypothetical protein
VNDSSVYDYSSYFTIEPEVNITSPTSNTSIEPGESYTIRWTDNFNDNVKLELYKGSSWQRTIASSTSSDGSYSWRVPTSLSSGTNYNIKIRSVNDSSVYDYSNSFTVQSTWPPTVTRDLNNYTGREEYSGYVGSDDYYKFYVDSPGYLQFALRGMSADADLQLLNSSGIVLESSRKSGNSDEYANKNLGIGTYYMRVYGHNGADTNYRLILNLDKAKNDRSNARWLGELAGQRKEYEDFIGTQSADQYDYYKFTLREPRFLEYALRGLTASADIDILNSSGARITPKENDKDNHPYDLHETMALQAGTYYARVTAPSISSRQTNYKLVLNLTGEYKPDKPDKPDIDIQLDFYGSFTATQKRLIKQAAENWENIITKDKVPNNYPNSGVLKIAVTRGDKTMDGKNFFHPNGDPNVTHWGEAFLDDSIDYRSDRTQYYLGDNRIHFNSIKLNELSDNLIVRLTMHEIGHTLGLDEAQYDYSLGYDSIMDLKGLDPKITEGVYKKLEQLGYEVKRNAYIDWS